MKDVPLSTLERDFLLQSLQEGKRLDGRGLTEKRNMNITLGADYGSCITSLGDTKVLAQVSCELTEPQTSRPNEGVLRIEVDFSPMAGPIYADGRTQDYQEEAVELQRLMERCLRESGCIDLESLCIVSESVVWGLRLDLIVLSNEGNLAEAASIAGLAALCHFRRPEVTLQGETVTVHPVSDRDPVSLSIHHHPVCSTFAFFNPKDLKKASSDSTPTTTETTETTKADSARIDRSSECVCTDPTWKEEMVMDGKLVFGVNPYREICTLHLAGNMLIDKTVVMKYAYQASQFSKQTVDIIKNKLAEDNEKREKGKTSEIGFSSFMREKQRSILANSGTAKDLDITKITGVKIPSSDEKGVKQEMEVVETKNGVVELRQKGHDDVDFESEEEEKGKDVVMLDDSDEDEIQVLKSTDMV